MSYEVSASSLGFVSAVIARAKPTTSLEVGWRSLLVSHNAVGNCELAETPPVPEHFISILTRGSGEFRHFDGGWRRGRLGVGTVNVIGASETLRVGWKATPGAPSLESLHVFMPSAVLRDAAEHFRAPGTRSSTPPITAIGMVDDAIVRVARSLLGAIRIGVPDIYAQTTAQWLAVHLLRTRAGSPIADDRRRPGRLADVRLSRVLELIDQHFGDELDLDVLAAEAGVSKFHFIRLFRRRTGSTPIQYLLAKRLDEAARMVGQDHMSMKSIAYACGFRSTSHFAEAFRRRFGSSPSTYRASG